MNPAIVVLVALMFSSAMLGALLAIAWASFGRPRHALIWALAFAVATLHWAIDIAYFFVSRGDPVWIAGLDTLWIAFSALVTLGFRERSGRGSGGVALLGTSLLAVALIVLAATALPHTGLRMAIAPLFAAGMTFSASVMVARRDQAMSAAEWATAALLVAFGAFDLFGAATALMQGAAGDARYAAMYETAMLLGLPGVFVGLGLFAVFLLAADLARAMRALAERDPLTGVLNRRGFEVAAAQAVALAQRHGWPLSVAAIDLDHFKGINDRHGHAAGDRTLQCFAAHVGGAIRRGDLFGRVGGEEFVLLLVNSPAAASIAVIERLRDEVACLEVGGRAPIAFTASFGVAELWPRGDRLETLIDRADRALYRSKQDGRNRVTLSGERGFAGEVAAVPSAPPAPPALLAVPG